MFQPTRTLPGSGRVDVGALSRLFDDATTSYKHLFFSALLTEFHRSGLVDGVMPLRSLGIGMLVSAWYPVRVYRLSLGVRDQAEAVLSRLPPSDGGPLPALTLRASLTLAAPDCSPLLRYVPGRLLSPFFAQDLRGKPDAVKGKLIQVLADDRFDAVRPLYRFLGADRIELHPDWVAYLAANFPIVSAWAERRWISYLQARNPAVPAVSEKLGPPLRRDPLTAQKRYWSRVMAAAPAALPCIYTGRPLQPDNVHLDHFLPWTFVCHDSLWNLLPVSPQANASKQNKLPDLSYLAPFARFQQCGLSAARAVMGQNEWEAATNSFVGELRIPEADLLTPGVLLDTYQRTVGSQLDIARAIGFEPGWRFAG